MVTTKHLIPDKPSYIRIKSITIKGKIVFYTTYHTTEFPPSHIFRTSFQINSTIAIFQSLTMALQFHHISRPIAPASETFSFRSLSSWPAKHTTVTGDGCRTVNFASSKSSRKISSTMAVRSSLETSGPAVVVGVVTEVDKDTFWPIVNAAGDKTVVLDMYTQWCGPCKIMAPKFEGLAEQYLDVVFLKLDCNQENKPLAKELGIKVVPTFKILKHSKIVKEVTGAKFDNLVASMEEVRSS
ncbi:thioredoxin F-type, chloroplastic-like [Rutidosis leptorrhynchoides]|uniref:thioredoxin F-type, chloroplastic-like n=1 Tax=Rutidosis leptorrhynchoides TaxID=125765 RepID=UPI003A990070